MDMVEEKNAKCRLFKKGPLFKRPEFLAYRETFKRVYKMRLENHEPEMDALKLVVWITDGYGYRFSYRFIFRDSASPYPRPFKLPR